MSLYSDLNEVLTPYAQQIKNLKADLGELRNPQRLGDGVDLNNVMAPGVYTLHTNNTYINKPASDAEHGILEVWDETMPNNVGRIFQRITYTYKSGRSNSEIWTRSYSRQSQIWSSWIMVGDDLSDITEVVQTTVRQTVYTPISYNDNIKSYSKTVNGITFTQNTNNKVTAVGTATENILYALSGTNDNLGFQVIGGETYRLRGCPSGGSNNTYRLDLRTAPYGGTVVCVDTGEGVIFTPESTGYLYPIIRIGNGTTVNLTFEVVLERQSFTEIADKPVKTAIDVIARSRIEVFENSAVSLTPRIKRALLNCLQHVCWDTEGAAEYYNALESALNESESNTGGE